jgi:hypothetical protein
MLRLLMNLTKHTFISHRVIRGWSDLLALNHRIAFGVDNEFVQEILMYMTPLWVMHYALEALFYSRYAFLWRVVANGLLQRLFGASCRRRSISTVTLTDSAAV